MQLLRTKSVAGDAGDDAGRPDSEFLHAVIALGLEIGQHGRVLHRRAGIGEVALLVHVVACRDGDDVDVEIAVC